MDNRNVEGFHLSPQQRHLWALSRQSEGHSYIAACAVKVRGDLDLARLRSVLEDLPRRHEILRTTFYISDEMSTPIQVISSRHEEMVELEHRDLAALDADGQHREIGRETDSLTRALAPDGTPKTRFALFTLSPREHVLVITASALRSDGCGLRNLVADIASCYEAALQRSAVADDDVLQYADASSWLNEMLESADTAHGRRFWESQQPATSLATRLPFERSDAPSARFAPRRTDRLLSTEVLAAARAVASACETSIDSVLLACWQGFLQRITDVDQIVVGVADAGRNYPELDGAVGLFSRCLPLSGDLPQEWSFADAVRHLGDVAAAAKQWGECFDWKRLATTVPTSDNPPFVPFVFESVRPVATYHATGVAFECQSGAALPDRFRLKLCSSAAAPESAGVWIEYDSAALHENDVARLAAQFETFAAAAVAAPETSLAALELLPASQRESITSLLGGSKPQPARSEPVHCLFEHQAARVPDATAVVCEDVAVTYAVLNERANRLAHHLQAHGVGPDVLVGLCLERSVEMVVALLAILKAGGAYVPLDPQLPPPRLAAILRESAATLVITREHPERMLPPDTPIIRVDRDDERVRAHPTTNPRCEAGPDNLVYVLFTSGSTGTPKGVAIEHRQLANYVHDIREALHLADGMSYATVTTIAADLGNTAVYPALTTGGTLHVVTESRAQDAEAFAAYMERHGIDVLKIVPSHLRALLSCSEPGRVLPRSRLVLGGEPCPWTLVDDVRGLAPACKVFNHYGPTETTVGATTYDVSAQRERPRSDTVPIGRPLKHVHAVVLNRRQVMVPMWTAGELYIGGAGVARGYLHDDALTSSRFGDDPLKRTTGQRWYRTGDRVRLLPTGDLEFLGRMDGQVKIRGYRVELGDVESSLRRHPAISDAAVLAREDDTDRQLTAFVVYGNGSRPTSRDVRNFLQTTGLPEYMIPGDVIELDAFPLTPNGKRDRTALLELAAHHAHDTAVGGDTSLTEWETVVASVWREFLAVDYIAANDNFYDLGGHSLIAIQVVTALEKRVGVHVSPRDLVFHTLRQFAVLCESKSALNEAQT